MKNHRDQLFHHKSTTRKSKLLSFCNSWTKATKCFRLRGAFAGQKPIILPESKITLFFLPRQLLFDLFDAKRNGAIEFEEFTRSLSIFHPDAKETNKVAYASGGRFKRRWEDRYGRVEGTGCQKSFSYKEHDSSLFKITLAFPSFVMESEVPDSELVC